MLKTAIVALNVGSSFAQSVRGKMELNEPEQIDCDENLLSCSDNLCLAWKCELSGIVNHQQKSCRALCPDNTESNILRKCTCTQNFGPIKILAPCRWESLGEPTCNSLDEQSLSEHLPLSQLVKSEEDVIIIQDDTNSRLRKRPAAHAPRQPLEPQYVTDEPTTTERITTTAAATTSPTTSVTTATTVSGLKCSNNLPLHDAWECNTENLTKGTVCRTRCRKKVFRKRCLCNKRGTCNWSPEFQIPNCIRRALTTVATTSAEVTTELSDDPPVMLNDAMQWNPIEPLERVIEEAVEIDHDMEEEVDMLEEEVMSDQSPSHFSAVFDFMRHIINVNSSMYGKMLEIVDSLVRRH